MWLQYYICTVIPFRWTVTHNFIKRNGNFGTTNEMNRVQWKQYYMFRNIKSNFKKRVINNLFNWEVKCIWISENTFFRKNL